MHMPGVTETIKKVGMKTPSRVGSRVVFIVPAW
jgi:hypothetical protein